MPYVHHHETRICVVCGKKYHPHSGNQNTCSPECSVALARKRDRAGYERYRKIPQVCKVCGKTFYAGYRKATCSRNCSGLWNKWHKTGQKNDRDQAKKAWNSANSISQIPTYKLDEYGFCTPFKDVGGCPLVDKGRISMDNLLDYKEPGGKSIREICHLPKRKRKEFTHDWLYSEYMAARGLMEEIA